MPADGRAIELQQFLGRFVVALGRLEGHRYVAVPALRPRLSVLRDQHRAGGQLLDALEDGLRRGGVAIAQEEVQRDGVDLRPLAERCDDGSHLRAEPDGAAANRVVNQLDAHGVARQDEASPACIPEGDAEHAVETIEDVGAPLLVAVNDGLGVGLRPELVSAALELGAQLLEVVDLTVEDDPDGLLGVGHWLMAAGQVDDGESTEAQPYRAVQVMALVVGTPVDDSRGHRLDVVQQNVGAVAEVVLSADSAHDSAHSSTLLSKSARLRNRCDCAHRCMGTLSQPTKSLRARNEPSGLRQRARRSATTAARMLSRGAERPRSRMATLTHSA